ncbi:MAG: hypothetical protein LBP41_02835 [Holosporaceae bacterium]|jgi:hypothetical protein|nr:hypothetical protein [Holosporaceae bacterium]
MNKLFSEILKVLLVIVLIVAAAYLTGNWEALIRLLKHGAQEIIGLCVRAGTEFSSIKEHFKW